MDQRRFSSLLAQLREGQAAARLAVTHPRWDSKTTDFDLIKSRACDRRGMMAPPAKDLNRETVRPDIAIDIWWRLG